MSAVRAPFLAAWGDTSLQHRVEGFDRATFGLVANPRRILLLVFAIAIPSCAYQIARDKVTKLNAHLEEWHIGTIGVDTPSFFEEVFDSIDIAQDDEVFAEITVGCDVPYHLVSKRKEKPTGG